MLSYYIFTVLRIQNHFIKVFYFYIKLILLSKIIQKKKNEVSTFKREMAIHYESFYKTLNYRKYKFSSSNMGIKFNKY